MNHACRVTWAHAGQRYLAHGLFRHTIDAVIWVLRNHPGAHAITSTCLKGQRHEEIRKNP